MQAIGIRVLNAHLHKKIFLLHRDHSAPAFFSDAFGINLYISQLLMPFLLSRNSYRCEETRATSGISW